MPDARIIRVAAWHLASGRIDGHLFAMAICVSLCLIVVLVGTGKSLARRNLQDSKSALRELVPETVPPDLNAAPAWLEAAKAFVVWRGRSPVVREEGLHDPKSFSPGSAARQYIAANAKFFSLAEEAAARPHAVWDVDYDDPGSLRDYSEAGTVIQAAKKFQLRALAHAHAGDWVGVQQDFELMCRAGRALLNDPRGLGFHGCSSINEHVVDGLQAALRIPIRSPGAADVARLRELAERQLRIEPRLTERMDVERRIRLALIDRVSAGDLPLDLMSVYANVTTPDLAAVRAIYPCDRANVLINFDGHLERARAFDAGLPRRIVPDVPQQTEMMFTLHAIGNFMNFYRNDPSTLETSARDYRTGWRLALLGLSALERRMATGRWPPRAEDAGVLEALIVDPFRTDGGALGYWIEPEGWLRVWSVRYSEEDHDGDWIFRVPPLPKEASRP